MGSTSGWSKYTHKASPADVLPVAVFMAMLPEQRHPNNAFFKRVRVNGGVAGIDNFSHMSENPGRGFSCEDLVGRVNLGL